MHETKALLQLPSVEVSYEPEPGTVAGFIATMASKVDELLIAAEYRPSLDEV